MSHNLPASPAHDQFSFYLDRALRKRRISLSRTDLSKIVDRSLMRGDLTYGFRVAENAADDWYLLAVDDTHLELPDYLTPNIVCPSFASTIAMTLAIAELNHPALMEAVYTTSRGYQVMSESLAGLITVSPLAFRNVYPVGAERVETALRRIRCENDDGRMAGRLKRIPGLEHAHGARVVAPGSESGPCAARSIENMYYAFEAVLGGSGLPISDPREVFSESFNLVGGWHHMKAMSKEARAACVYVMGRLSDSDGYPIGGPSHFHNAHEALWELGAHLRSGGAFDRLKHVTVSGDPATGLTAYATAEPNPQMPSEGIGVWPATEAIYRPGLGAIAFAIANSANPIRALSDELGKIQLRRPAA